MIKLSVVEIAGPYCATYKEGAQLFLNISPLFKASIEVQLDFSDVELTSSSFFNELFGSITESFGEEFLDQHLSFISLKPRHKYVLDKARRVNAA